MEFLPSRHFATTIRRWLYRQMRNAGPLRERVEAAIVNRDPAEMRLVVRQFRSFSDVQRRHVEELIQAWEQAIVDERFNDPSFP